MTEKMLAGVSSETGLSLTETPVPRPGDGQVLIAVKAAGINRADLNAARGAGVATRASLGKPIGMEWAGEVVALGRGVDSLRVGDKVACSGTGGYASFAVTDAGRCFPLARDMQDWVRYAVLPLAVMTAHNALITQGRLPEGGCALVQGASSAVGLAALQIAALKGARVIIGTSTNPAKRARLTEFGATLALDPTHPDWVSAVLEATGGKGADTVVDMVSGSGINALMKASAIQGRIVNVGRLGGTTSEFDFDLHAARRLDYIGVTFRTRSPEEIRTIVDLARSDLWADIEDGRLALPVDRVFPLAEAVAAHEHMRSSAHFGKIVLVP
ncbi:quinone oxidoreductase family protein [Pseudochelatococcus sp. B33]